MGVRRFLEKAGAFFESAGIRVIPGEDPGADSSDFRRRGSRSGPRACRRTTWPRAVRARAGLRPRCQSSDAAEATEAGEAGESAGAEATEAAGAGATGAGATGAGAGATGAGCGAAGAGACSVGAEAADCT